MRTRSPRTQILVALGYLAVVLLVLWLQADLIGARRAPGLVPADRLWLMRAALLVFAAVGALTVTFALWGLRNRVGAAFVAAVLTVVVVTLPTAFGLVVVDPLTRLWVRLWLQASSILPVLLWGAAVATWIAALVVARGSTRRAPLDADEVDSHRG